MISIDARVLSNHNLLGDLWQLELAASEIPETIVPGQYVHLRLPESPEHMLRRPFTVHRVSVDEGECDSLTITYQVVGSLTALMSQLTDKDQVNLLGPLGQGWRLPVYSKRALLVAGGVGWASLAMAAGSLAAFSVQTHLLVGARNADYLKALAIGINERPYPLNLYGSAEQTGDSFIHYATDDGSLGHHGMNTELLEELLQSYEFDYIATCGPEAMQRIVALTAEDRGINCEVSLERRMACGLGACLSCTVLTKHGNQKVCTDGPVFNATEIIW